VSAKAIAAANTNRASNAGRLARPAIPSSVATAAKLPTTARTPRLLVTVTPSGRGTRRPRATMEATETMGLVVKGRSPECGRCSAAMRPGHAGGLGGLEGRSRVSGRWAA